MSEKPHDVFSSEDVCDFYYNHLPFRGRIEYKLEDGRFIIYLSQKDFTEKILEKYFFVPTEIPGYFQRFSDFLKKIRIKLG